MAKTQNPFWYKYAQKKRCIPIHLDATPMTAERRAGKVREKRTSFQKTFFSHVQDSRYQKKYVKPDYRPEIKPEQDFYRVRLYSTCAAVRARFAGARSVTFAL